MAHPENKPRASNPEGIGGFKPGQSGNPGGRPKGLAAAVRELAPAADLAKWYTAIWLRDEATLAGYGISLEAVTLAERNKAGEWLTERGYGKAPAFAPVEGGDPLEREAADAAIGATVDELAERREAPATGGATPSELARTG